MLKMIIADDERIIRETISKLIDWESIGVELVGLCKNGVEAYDMIVDESPDIVLTDIKMPGLSGIELVKKGYDMGLDTQFILLSGYGEFSLAQEAMKYGVQHYLLKPGNEKEIISCISAIQKDCYYKRAFHELQEQQKFLTCNLYNHVMLNIMSEGLSHGSINTGSLSLYEQFLDVQGVDYELYYLFYLEEKKLPDCLEILCQFQKKHAPGIQLYMVYVRNTLLLFYQSYGTDYPELNNLLSNMNQFIECDIEFQRNTYKGLETLLQHIIEKTKRYSLISYYDGKRFIPIYNYTNFMIQIAFLIDGIYENLKSDSNEKIEELITNLKSINELELLKQIASNLLLKLNGKIADCSSVTITECLLELNQMDQPEDICMIVRKEILSLKNFTQRKDDDFMGLQDYVRNHIGNSNLTLKWIAENCLFMNVDYLSRKFKKETGKKFSAYVAEVRIQKAKELIARSEYIKMQTVAEFVGCGDNYQYFSQIFKKQTGMTPSDYAKTLKKISI